MLVFFYAGLSRAASTVDVGIGWAYPPQQTACFQQLERSLAKAVVEHGYRIRATLTPGDVWLDIQAGKRREPGFDNDDPAVTHLTVYDGERSSSAVADTVVCGPQLEAEVTEQALALLEDAARLVHDQQPQRTWNAIDERPYSYFKAYSNRFRGERQPLELGIFGFFPGSSELSVGISARTNNSLFGVALGPDVAFWHDHRTTVWEPALTAALSMPKPFGPDLAWSWGLEAAAVLDIWSTPDDKGVKLAGRLGAPVTIGSPFNHAVLTVMPYIRSGGLDLKVNDVTAYHAEIWGILARVSWGMGGLR